MTTWKTKVVDHVADVRESTWREALEKSSGNITKAAESLGIHRVHGARLTKKFDLVDLARQLRIKATGHDRGRPWRAAVGERGKARPSK